MRIKVLHSIIFDKNNEKRCLDNLSNDQYIGLTGIFFLFLHVFDFYICSDWLQMSSIPCVYIFFFFCSFFPFTFSYSVYLLILCWKEWVVSRWTVIIYVTLTKTVIFCQASTNYHAENKFRRNEKKKNK